MRKSIVSLLKKEGRAMGADEVALALKVETKADVVYRILERLTASVGYGIKKISTNGGSPFNSKYTYEASSSTNRPWAP